MPLGLRLACAQVRNYELRLRKARRVLEVQEEEVARELNNAVLEMDRWYLLAESGSKRADVAINYAATAEERVASDNSRDPASIGRVLEAKITSRDADQSYLRSIVEYNKAINELNFRKGTLLQANSIYLAEGEWNPLAYQQAAERGEALSSGLDNEHVEATPEEFTRGPAPSAWESRGDPTRPFVPGALEQKSPAATEPATQLPVTPVEKSAETTLAPTVPPATTSATAPSPPKIKMPATNAAPERLPATRAANQLPRILSPGDTSVNTSKTTPNSTTQPPTRSPQPASPQPAAKPGPPQQSLPVIPPPAPRPPLAEKAQPAPPAKQLAPPMVPAVPAQPPVPAKPVSSPGMVPRAPLTSPTSQMRPFSPVVRPVAQLRILPAEISPNFAVHPASQSYRPVFSKHSSRKIAEIRRTRIHQKWQTLCSGNCSKPPEPPGLNSEFRKSSENLSLRSLTLSPPTCTEMCLPPSIRRAQRRSFSMLTAIRSA
ncbi:MAG UNVERIFIED_CONTAM: hypothetical protein LVR18_09685 [Planctomycetaceae bacterium]|jgi:hypothetical protein